MWSLVPRRFQVLLLVVATLVSAEGLQGLRALSSDEVVTSLRWASLIATFIGVVLAGFGQLTWRWFWRVFPLLGRRVFPDLNGRWEGNLHSIGCDPATSPLPPPIPVIICIRQTLWTVSVTLKSGESSSSSTRAFLEPAGEHGKFRVWYSYNNEPDAKYRHRSSVHEGVCFLEFDVAIPDWLEGQYYTARKTTGDVEVKRISTNPDAPKNDSKPT